MAAQNPNATEQVVAASVAELADELVKRMPAVSISVGGWTFEEDGYLSGHGGILGRVNSLRFSKCAYLGMDDETIVARRAFIENLPKLLTEIEKVTRHVAAADAKSLAILERITAPPVAEAGMGII